MRQLVKAYRKMKYLGIWVWIPILCACVKLRDLLPSGDEVYLMMIVLSIGVLIQAYIWQFNQSRVENGLPDDKVGMLDAFFVPKDEYSYGTGRRKHLHPDPPEDMLFKYPTGFCFGKHKGRYCCRTDDAGGNPNVLICGGSGSGKTSCFIIAYLLIQRAIRAGIIFVKKGEKKRGNQNEHGGVCNLIADIKGEVQNICSVQGKAAEKIDDVVINPLERGTYGVDCLYMLTETSTEQEVYEAMDIVASSIIPDLKGDNAIWSSGAKKIFLGLGIYLWKYRRIRNMAAIMKEMLSAPMKELIEEAVTASVPGSRIYRALNEYTGNFADETFASITMNLFEALFPLTVDDHLSYALGENPKKFTPDMLLEHDCFLQIPDYKLASPAWARFTVLVVNLVLQWVLRLGEYHGQRRRVGIILDETVAILKSAGSRMDLAQVMRLNRSKGVQIFLAVQSRPGLTDVLGSKEEAMDLLSNISSQVYLDAGADPEVQETISRLVGKYRSRSVSYGDGGKTSNTSYEDRQLIEESELVVMGGSEECIVISSRCGYLRLEKVPYYKDAFIKGIHKKLKGQDIKKNKKKKEKVNKKSERQDE